MGPAAGLADERWPMASQLAAGLAVAAVHAETQWSSTLVAVVAEHILQSYRESRPKRSRVVPHSSPVVVVVADDVS